MLGNPVIELFRNPVATLAALGYAALLSTLLWLTTVGLWRNAVAVKVQWDTRREGPNNWQYLPPGGFIARVAAFPAAVWIDAWLLGALIWLLT